MTAKESTFGADNHRILETSPDTITRTYTVDALGRRRSAAYSPVIAGEATSTGWSYDENGNVLAVSDRIGEGQFITLTRTWDRRDRIASETDPFGRTLRYTYDAYGNRKSRIDVAADETTTYQYDARHRNISVTSRSHGTTALAWYRDDRLRTITQPGNVVSTTTWDRAGRVDTITHTANGTPLVTLSYDYDRNGNRDAETLAHAGQPPVVSTYTHDEADRLASMTVDGATTTYTLDGAGNRTRETTARGSQPPTLDRTCTFDPRDRLEGCTDSVSGVNETHGWDATGRRTSETVGGLTRTTTWDARDRLLTLTESGGPTTTYTYDPEGQRIESRRGAEGERVQYDAGHRHAETNGAGNVTRTYQATAPHRATSRGAWARAGAAAMTLFLGMADAGAIPTPRHYLHDAHGTPVAITTHEGALAQRSTWDVWGNPTQVETLDTGLTANPNRIGFTGYVLDLEGSRTSSGASATANSPISNARYYAKARYYGAGRGSFLSVDPWDGDPTSPVSLYKYLYGYANPGVYIDPDGRCVGPFIIPCAAAIATGGTYAIEYVRAAWFGSPEEQQDPAAVATASTAYALETNLTAAAGAALVVQTGGTAAPLAAGLLQGGRTGLNVALMQNAPRVAATADDLAYLAAGVGGANTPPLTSPLALPTAHTIDALVDAAQPVIRHSDGSTRIAAQSDVPTAPSVNVEQQRLRIVESNTLGVDGEIDALRRIGSANSGGAAANSVTGFRVTVSGAESGGRGLGANRTVDRVAFEYAGAVQQANRILQTNRAPATAWERIYRSYVARGESPPEFVRGNAIQQIADDIMRQNRYARDAEVMMNRQSRVDALQPLRPDVQVPITRSSQGVIDITTPGQAAKIDKYDDPANKALINILYKQQ